jgi:hypothetical protein
MSQGRSQGLVCPSGRCAAGSKLIGIVGPDGRLGYVTPPLEVDANFIEVSKRGTAPESRFRFSEPCLEQNCQHWADDECGLIGRMCAGADNQPGLIQDDAELPRCAIRSECRWFSQRGREACAVCPLVVRIPRQPRADAERIAPKNNE